MNTSVTSEVEGPRPRGGGRMEKAALLAFKLGITGACFWYVSRQIDLWQVLSTVPLLDWRWIVLAIGLVVIQIPIVAMRWRNILHGLSTQNCRFTIAAITAITSIGQFLAQVLPTVAGEGVRAWLLVRLGCTWRNAVSSVMIDRSVGVGLLIALGFIVLLLPSGLTALSGYREPVLISYGALLVAGACFLLLVPQVAPPLRRWRYSRWIGSLAFDIHNVLVGPRAAAVVALGLLVHALTIVIVWSVGQAQGLDLPLIDAAVLFTVMIGVVLIPISISGWGVREVAVMSILGSYGAAPEQGLLFSICFGLVLALGSLPGAVVLLLYSVGQTTAAWPWVQDRVAKR